MGRRHGTRVCLTLRLTDAVDTEKGRPGRGGTQSRRRRVVEARHRGARSSHLELYLSHGEEPYIDSDLNQHSGTDRCEFPREEIRRTTLAPCSQQGWDCSVASIVPDRWYGMDASDVGYEI